MDPNPCRARTPGFEALGGWLKDDGRDLGDSKVWVRDTGALSDAASHGAQVWLTLSDCSVRSVVEAQYFDGMPPQYFDALFGDGRDSIESSSFSPDWEDIEFPAPEPWANPYFYLDGTRDGQRILRVSGAGNDPQNRRTGELQTTLFQRALVEKETSLWLLVGGYVGEGDDRRPASSSSTCGEADPLCLFAPWRGPAGTGTSFSTPQVAAALDTVWAVWPEMDVLDLRNLAFDCAENMDAPEGETAVTRSYSYANGRSFTSDTNSTWGHGILSLTCLFTPNGGLQNPVTGTAISGGISGPLAGPVAGASIGAVDYTGRDFGYGFARPVARENLALASLTQAAPRGGAATANLRPSGAHNGFRGLPYGSAAYSGRLWHSGAVSVHLTAAAPRGAAGNAMGLVTQWQNGNLTLRGGIAAQPEGVGSLSGSRAFRAPSAVSAALTMAYGREFRPSLSVHLQADHWRTLATRGRSLWEGAKLRESRLTAALVQRAGRHEISLQGVWRSGLSGSLDVSGRNWALAPDADSGVWLTWRRRTQ